PSTISPQFRSMSSSWRTHSGVFVDSLSDGEGAQPYADPRPVVNTIMLAPPATWPVADTGSYPGVSMKTNPFASTGSAYSYTSMSPVVPPLATAPSDFSRIVVSPPALFPGDGLLFISPWLRAVYSSHQWMRSTIFSPTALLRARRVSRCSAP